MNDLIVLLKNDLIRILNYRPFVYLVIGWLSVLLLGLIFSNEDILLRLSRNADESNLYVSFYWGNYLVINFAGVILVNLSVFFLLKIEDDSQMWKYVLSLPIPLHLYLFSKILACAFLNLLAVCVAFLVLSLEGAFLPYFLPKLVFLNYTSALLVLFFFLVKFSILSFAITSFQVVILLLVKNETLGLILSVSMPIACLFNFLDFLPYGWPNQNFWLTLKNKYHHKAWQPTIDIYESLSLIAVVTFIVTIYCFGNRFFKRLKTFT